MEKTVVIYKTKYGATKRYADWIGEELDCPVISADDFNKKDFELYDNIVYGGGVHAGGLKGFDLIKKNIRRLEGKKIVAFAVGLNLMDKEARMQLREINFDKPAVKTMTCYYCPGAFNPDNVTGIDKMIIGMMVSMIESKPYTDITENDKKLLDAVKNGADMVERKFIEPIVAEFK
ncbi:MAG: hypothetical protein IJP00_04390 [Firmicutes bacterium]|nr:hypothetical protein [Bacillota bacterium]